MTASARRLITIGTAALVRLGTPAFADDVTGPAHDYLLSCGGCHGLDGAGSARVPSLRGVDALLARPAGRAYVLRVPGVASAPLSDARLAALLDWVFLHFDNRTPTHFTAAEVGAARAEPWVDPKAARAALD
jgi:mono/diheme cytochrome c family protein